MTMIRTADDLLTMVEGIDRQAIAWEHKTLLAIKEWALDRLGIDYRVGDRVRIKDGYEVKERFSDGASNGWWSYRDCLVPGATATVTRINFNAAHHYWYADIILDREFAWNDYLKRHNWHGPADQTPAGMEPPSTFEQEHHPEGRRHTFSFQAEMLERLGGEGDHAE